MVRSTWWGDVRVPVCVHLRVHVRVHVQVLVFVFVHTCSVRACVYVWRMRA